MSLFSTALSGLHASSDALSVTGNNIANANTVGYKTQTISFADIFLGSLGVRLNGAGVPLQTGNGVTTGAILTNFSQGNLTSAASPVNMAIQGNGYFIEKDGTGTLSYSRAGDFIIDRDGYIVSPSGQQVQGYAAVNGQVPDNAPLTSIQVPIGKTLSPQETTEASLRINLNSADATGAKFNASVQVYDSLGVAHTLNLSFEKTGDLAYSVTADLDGKAATLDNSSLTFDANGNLTDPTSISVTPDASALNGATLNGISLNLFETNADGSQGAPLITNFAATSNVSATSQDGFAPGTIAGLSVDPSGTLIASFSNGQTRPIAQVAVATFNSQDGLSRVGNNLFVETAGSGPASVGRPGSGGRGNIAGNALEESNVDIATEFTNLIVAQRSFQSNSKVITTVNQTLQDLLQII